jgi:YbbR domain-containing protein
VRKRIWDDIGTALLALLLSMVVWTNAMYQEDRPYEGTFARPVPITVLNAPPGFVATNESIQQVELRIKTFSSRWDTLRVTDFNAVSDWSGLGEGMHAVPVEVTVADPTVNILSVQPSTVYVRLEQVKQELKEVQVNLINRDDVPLGYRIYAPEVKPEMVRVDGPSSLVDRVSHVRVAMSLLNERATVEKDLAPVAVDEAGQVVSGVRLTPQTVAVTVAIERRQNYREVAVRVRTTGHPARGYYLSGVSVVPATVTVVGPPSVIETMGGLIEANDEIDITGATRMIAERIELDLPEGVSVLDTREGERPSVLVTVSIDAMTGGITMDLPLGIKKLRPDLVARLSVSELDVILTGPSVLLDELEPDLLEAYVDLGGLGPGTHQVKPVVNLLVSQDSKLRDLVVSDVSPKSVEVIISEPPTITPTPTPDSTTTGALEMTPTITATQTVTGTVVATPLLPIGTLTATVAPAETPTQVGTRTP